jgi:hypothetical protein
MKKTKKTTNALILPALLKIPIAFHLHAICARKHFVVALIAFGKSTAAGN